MQKRIEHYSSSITLNPEQKGQGDLIFISIDSYTTLLHLGKKLIGIQKGNPKLGRHPKSAYEDSQNGFRNNVIRVISLSCLTNVLYFS